MTENSTSTRLQKFSQLWYESGEAVVRSAFEIQERSVQYAQKSFEDGLETLKSNIETSQSSMHRGNNSMDQQEGIQANMEGRAEAYKRNLAFWQRAAEQGTEIYKVNVGSMRDLALTLMKKTQEQREIFF